MYSLVFIASDVTMLPAPKDENKPCLEGVNNKSVDSCYSCFIPISLYSINSNIKLLSDHGI